MLCHKNMAIQTYVYIFNQCKLDKLLILLKMFDGIPCTIEFNFRQVCIFMFPGIPNALPNFQNAFLIPIINLKCQALHNFKILQILRISHYKLLLFHKYLV